MGRGRDMMTTNKGENIMKTLSICLKDQSPVEIKLTKDQAKSILEKLMMEGVNPDELRAIPD